MKGDAKRPDERSVDNRRGEVLAHGLDKEVTDGMTALYTVTIGSDEPLCVDAETLLEAWGEQLPTDVANILDLRPGASVTASKNPRIVITRLR